LADDPQPAAAATARCEEAGDGSRLLASFVPVLSNVVTGVPPTEPTETTVCGGKTEFRKACFLSPSNSGPTYLLRWVVQTDVAIY
jgi:hypothetical protein